MKTAYTQKISKRDMQCSLLSDSKHLTRKKKFPVAYINRRLTVLYDFYLQAHCAVSFSRGLILREESVLSSMPLGI